MKIFALVRDTFKDKSFLRRTADFSLSVILTYVLTTVTNLVDTMMVGTLGEVSISAVGLANKFFYVFTSVVFGVHSGAGLLMAQYYGAGNEDNVRKTFSLGFIINIFCGLLFFVVATFFPGLIMGIFTTSPESTAAGIMYLRASGLSYLLFAVSSILSSFLKSTYRVKVTAVSSIVSILSNVFFNYCLIYGAFGFPALGIVGAAIATVLARFAEMMILVGFIVAKDKILKAKLSHFFGWSPEFTAKFIKCSVPIMINEVLWGLGTSLYYVGYGHMGDKATAVVTITDNVIKIFNTAANGLASASLVLLGMELGAGKVKEAWDHSRKLIVLGICIALMCSATILLIRVPVMGFFDVSEEVFNGAVGCMGVYACTIPFYYVYCIVIVGILRSGGDSKASMVLDSSGVWFVALPLVLLGAFVWKLPIVAVYALSLLEEVLKTFACLIRYRKKKWLRNLT
ncbi:MAG: MATE family efflux transporter [Eubacteriales bacterium]|nr:MATE family efflux transporter [Eubacteriales bacterium]